MMFNLITLAVPTRRFPRISLYFDIFVGHVVLVFNLL